MEDGACEEYAVSTVSRSKTKKADAFLLRTCHISGTKRASRARQDRGRTGVHSSHDSKTISEDS